MNFNITTSFDTEIEQLKVKLAELKTQKHRISACANRIVTQVGECVTEMKQVGVSDEILTDWACVIYKEITGEDTPIAEDYGNNKTLEINRLLGIIQANESAIDQVRNTWEEKENRWYEERKELEATLNDALQKVTNLTAASLRVSDELNVSKKTILELTTANQKLTEEVLELRGESSRTILKESIPLAETQVEKSEEDPRQDPKFLEATKNQEIIAEFLKKLDRTTRVDKLTWRKIRELPFNPETMRELGLQINPKSKIHKYLLEQMPVMCAKYVEETGDSSDLDWLPEHFVEQVEYLLKMEASGSASDESGEVAE